MKHIKYIFILFLSLFAASCTTDDIVTNVSNGQYPSGQIQLAARFLPFSEYDVKSRAADDITYDFVIFGTKPENNKELVCVYYNHSVNEVVGVDRTSDFEGINQSWLEDCYVYVLANYSAIYNHITTLANEARKSASQYIKDDIIGQVGANFFTDIAQPIAANVNLSENALPRFGEFSEGINFREDNNEITPGTMYTINMRSLYAKMVFNISVDPTEQVADITIPNANTFQIKGYTVNNLAKTVDLFSGSEIEDEENEIEKTHDAVEVYTESVNGVLGNDVNQTPTTELSFSFYLPERFFKPKTSADEYEYPFGKGSSIREEDLDRRQRYKPLLGRGYTANDINYAEATYVTISGVFTNHQGHTFDVSYDIYVGNDNFGNFDIVRNRQYNNSIKITGIHNSTNQESGEVSIDHRVNISHTRPIYSNLRRETLLDAHYEVRPLRIKRNHSHSGDETHVKVEVSYENTNTDDKPADDEGHGNWIGLERSFGDGVSVKSSTLYCVGDGSSAGKRKYFTYDLVDKSLSKGPDTDTENPLHTSTSVIVPIPPKDSDDNECVWIYVDECTEASTSIDAKRSATIRLTCGKYANGNFTPVGESLDYIINQHKLFEINVNGRTYHIEHEEEYLYNFDSEDIYGTNNTEFNGMEWGLNGIQLSNLYPAIHLGISSGIISIILELFGGQSTETIINNQLIETGLDPKYDFYIPRDITNDKLTIRGYSGYTFNQELANYINNGNKAKIEQITLGEKPESAFAYCYNRNKRDKNGNVISQNWYMPAIDELEEIMKNSYLYFTDFHGQYYWSCQPAYKKYNMEFVYLEQDWLGGWSESNHTGFFYLDNTERARATKVKINNQTGNFEDIISSASDVYGTQEGEIKIYFWTPKSSTFTLGDRTENSVSYDAYPGNKSRNDKCRVRAVYRKSS